MARRALVVWIDMPNKSTCHGCDRLVFAGLGTGKSACRLFLKNQETDAAGLPMRLPDCLKAETFAGG